MKFRRDDAVRQVDGGPQMVVDAFDDLKNVYYCQWMDGDLFKGGYFPEENLQLDDVEA